MEDPDPDDEFEPLFDYTRVQPVLVCLDDDSLDVHLAFDQKRKRASDSTATVEEGARQEVKVSVLEEKEEDWLPPPPKKAVNVATLTVNSTIQEMRLKKQELVSLAQSAKDVLREVEAAARREVNNSEKPVQECVENKDPRPQNKREKILISVQDKNGLKQFRMYMDDTFEKIFKMYTEILKTTFEKLVFSFDGDKVSPTATPVSLGMENEDIIEVSCKPN